jgi:hypothetical protein
MSKHYPIKFTLEDGVDVEVNKTATNTYDFTMVGSHQQARRFTIVDDDRPKDEITRGLNFDELNAVRRFWLEADDSV